jgi:hypothetical protein
LAAVNWAEGTSEKTVVEGKPSNTDSEVYKLYSIAISMQCYVWKWSVAINKS